MISQAKAVATSMNHRDEIHVIMSSIWLTIPSPINQGQKRGHLTLPVSIILRIIHWPMALQEAGQLTAIPNHQLQLQIQSTLQK